MPMKKSKKSQNVVFIRAEDKQHRTQKWKHLWVFEFPGNCLRMNMYSVIAYIFFFISINLLYFVIFYISKNANHILF